MVELAVDYYPGIGRLLRGRAPAPGYVKMGEWLPGEAAQRAVAEVTGTAILYHHGDSLVAGGAPNEDALAALFSWQERVRPPWLSAHLDCWARGERRALVEHGTPLARYESEQALALVCEAVHATLLRLGCPLLLENTDCWPAVDPLVSRPEFIRQVLEETGCGLLLDVAHAQVTAAALGCDVHGYLKQLPLERTVEVHVSGPREVEGRLVDGHEPLREEDYALLGWLLERAEPRVVTLEYSRDPEQVRRQLRALQRLIAAC